MGISFYFLFSFIFSFFMIKFYNSSLSSSPSCSSCSYSSSLFFIAIFQIWFNLLYNFINLLSFLVIFHLTSSLCFRMIIFELDNFTFLKISFLGLYIWQNQKANWHLKPKEAGKKITFINYFSRKYLFAVITSSLFGFLEEKRRWKRRRRRRRRREEKISIW